MGAREKEGKMGEEKGSKKFSLLSSRPPPRSFWLAPFSPLVSSFNMRFREQNAPEENACTVGYIIVDLISSQSQYVTLP